MNTYVDDCDLDVAKLLRALVWKAVRPHFAAKDPVREAWDRSSSHSERLHSEDLGRGCETRFWSDSCSYHCLDSPSHRLIPSYCQNRGAILECASLSEVCCSCHAVQFSIFPSLSHGSQDLSHAGASGLERKSDTFSVLSHTQLNGLLS